MSVSFVYYCGEQNSKCGYCTGVNGSKSHGMQAVALTCEDYQELIDRGWRRCGNYCYKPQNDETCCPCYTIKCDALKFKLTKSNKRILRRMNKFLRDGKREPSEQQQQRCGDGDDVGIGAGVNAGEPQPQLPDKKPPAIDVEQVESLVQAHAKKLKQTQDENAVVTAGVGDQTASNKCKPAEASTNPPRKKAKQMRRERWQVKMGTAEPQQLETKALSQEKSLKDFVEAASETDKHQLKITLVAALDTQRTCTDAVLALYRKYQLAIHHDNPARLTLASMQRFLVKSPLKLRLVEVHSEEFEITLQQSFELYKKYQIVIHNDMPKNLNAYKDHLQVSPMKRKIAGPEMGYGSFHQQYWLDDKLIAVGVIDILPGSVSSVYFFYDPDYSFLSLGTYGSLREIDFVQTIAEHVPALKYYYMGFYIHSCPKMRYKGKLAPSYLLCPETYVWMPLTDAIRSSLDVNKYQRLNPDAAARDANAFLNQHLNDVVLLLGRSCTTYKRFVQLTGNHRERDFIIEYGKLVGKVCAHRIWLYNYHASLQ